jgi:hypothetical protein
VQFDKVTDLLDVLIEGLEPLAARDEDEQADIELKTWQVREVQEARASEEIKSGPSIKIKSGRN